MNNILLYIIIALLIVIMAYLIWDRQRAKKLVNDPTQHQQQPVNNQNTVNTVTTPKQETNTVATSNYSNNVTTTTQTVQTQTQNPVRGNIVLSETEPVKSLKEATILVVEDDVDLRQYLKEELTGEVKEVLMAGDGIEAVDILQSKTVHIVVSDVMMPRMDGFSLCKYIKTTIEISHTPVILLTARTD
jgi:Response regulators consisting of a CheY-like receiver domain and a winged-helix DNA-binding domain